MTVILEIIDTPEAAQGVALTNVICTLKNTGTEDIENLYLKVIDAVVFSKLYSYWAASSYLSCLNVSAKIWNFTDGNYIFPAGTEKNIKFRDWDIKADAPTGDNQVNTNFGYELV